MIRTAIAVRTLKAVALAVGLAVFLWGTGLPAFFQNVEAAALSNASDTLSNSAPSGSSVHTIQFTTPNGMATGEVFVVDLDDLFDTSSLVVGDVSMTVNGQSTTTAAAAAADTWGIDIGGDSSIEFETPTDDANVSSSSVFVITIGDEAGTMIVSPAATGSYAIGIGTDGATTTIQDSAEVRVAIIEEVTVSASVPTTLEFSVSGVGAGQSVNSSPTTTSAVSTNTTLPFGELTANVSRVLAQDLTVTTNAANGVAVTVVTTGDLESSTGATIDTFNDGTDVDSGSATGWVAPAATPGSTDTYGHWGVTTEDSNITAGDLWFAASTTPRTVFDAGTAVNASTTRVGYQTEISSLQEAGTDYSTELRYIATPVF